MQRAVFKEARRTVLGADYEAPPEDEEVDEDGEPTLDPDAPWRRGVQDSFYGRAVKYNFPRIIDGRFPVERVGVRMFPARAEFPAIFSDPTLGGGNRDVVKFEWDLTGSGYGPTIAKAWLGDEASPAGLSDSAIAAPPVGLRTASPHRVFAQNAGELRGDVEEHENYWYVDLQMSFNNPGNKHLGYTIRYGDLTEVGGSAPLYSRGVDMAYLFNAINLNTGVDINGDPVPSAHVQDGRVQYIEFDFRLEDADHPPGPWKKYRIHLNQLPLWN